MGDEVRIRLARDRADIDSCVLLQRAVWGLGDLEITSAIQMIATTHAGGIVQIAESDSGQALGFAYAFPALRGGVAHLHSDMLAVLPEYQKRGLGARLKWAQREEALKRAISLITWTYDPLQARNANLNLRRLGAIAPEFFENFYGLTSASLHHGLPTDRLVAEWWLKSKRVETLLANGVKPSFQALAAISVPAEIYDWRAKPETRSQAQAVQDRNREGFLKAFAGGFAVLGYERDAQGNGRFLLGRWEEEWAYAGS